MITKILNDIKLQDRELEYIKNELNINIKNNIEYYKTELS
jgi:hypothetical protein